MSNIQITGDLAKALLHRKDARRSRLRQMATPLMKTIPESKWVNAAQVNDRVKKSEINPTMTLTGIRDNMTVLALASLVSGMQAAESTCSAIALNTNPSEFGYFYGAGGAGDTHFRELYESLSVGDPAGLEESVQRLKELGYTVSIEPGVETIMRDYKPDSKQEEEDDSAGAAPVSAPAIKLPTVDKAMLGIVDSVLKQVGAPSYDSIRGVVDNLEADLAKAKSGPKGMILQLNFTGQPNLAAKGGVPAGKMNTKKASDVFGIDAGKEQFDFDVPVFEWDAPHPYVPAVDTDYQFQPEPLLKLLWALVTNKKAWLHGHTGTGKSTLVEQVCARLNYPMVRVNFDSEITRMDLIGRDKLAVDPSGNTITNFEDGILPRAMQMPCVILCDEMDFIRPDVAYVMQRALEDKGLLVTEDGGRLVQPDPMFRIVATANTKGSGDDSGRYMGARPQSAAFLDRFTSWIGVDYMSTSSVAKLVKAKVPGIDSDFVSLIKNYAQEHWVGFRNGDILQPLSPRGLLAVADAYTFFKGVMPKTAAVKLAFDTAISERCGEADAQTIAGLVQRVTK